MFGFGKLVTDEAQAIAKLVNEVDPQITFPRFQQIVKNLEKEKFSKEKPRCILPLRRCTSSCGRNGGTLTGMDLTLVNSRQKYLTL